MPLGKTTLFPFSIYQPVREWAILDILARASFKLV